MKRLGVLLVALVLLASNTWAFRDDCGMGLRVGMSPHLASILNLTEDQKVMIQAKREAFQAEVDPLCDRLMGKKLELRNLWLQTNPDQAKVAAKQKEIQLLHAQIQQMATQHQLECRELLSPEQQEKLGTLAVQRGGWGTHGWKMLSQ